MPTFIVKRAADMILGEPYIGRWDEEGGGLTGKQRWLASLEGQTWLTDPTRRVMSWRGEPKDLYAVINADDAWHTARRDRAIVDKQDEQIRRADEMRTEGGVAARMLAVEVDGRAYTQAEVREARTRLLVRLAEDNAKRTALLAQPNCLDDHELVYFEDVE